MAPHRPTLLEGDIAQQLRGLAGPLALGLIAVMAFGVIDAWFISYLGTKYLAALGFTLPVVMMFMGVIWGLSVGISSSLSRVYGSGDMEEMRQMSTDAITLSAAMVLACSVVGFFLIKPIFILMGATPDLMPIIYKYMAIWYCGLPFMGVLSAGNACVRATGDTKFPSQMMILLSVCNFIFDPLFIFGWGPFPRLELAGASTTLVVSYYITCMVSMYVLIFKYKSLSPVLFHRDMLASWKRILHVAVPSIINNQISPISAAIVIWMASGFGREAVAALGVATRIEGFAILVFYALGAGTSIFVGQNFGAGNFGRIQTATRIASKYVILWGLFLAAIFWGFAQEIPPLFDDNPDVVSFAVQYLHWVPISYGAFGVLVVTYSALYAMGRPFPAMFLITLRAVILYVPLAWFLKAEMGFEGILAALLVTNLVVGSLAYLWHMRAAS